MGEVRFDAPPELLQRWKDLRARKAELDRAKQERWKRDPVAWARERLGEHMWSRQADVLRSVAENPLTAVQSCHGIGKSHLASRAVAWMVDVHEPGEVFVVTTAPTAAQVRAIMWRYIRQVHAKGLPGEVMQTAEWKIGGELVGMGRKPSDYDDAAFQGIHAPVGVLVVIDEASGVDQGLWVAADALATTPQSRVLAIGNPDVTGSQFHRVCTTEPGWKRFKISAFDSPNLTGEQVPPHVANALVSKAWVEDKRLRWGEGNPLYKAKVLAEFADSDDSMIPLSWVTAANRRWVEWDEAGRPPQPGRLVLGVDVARFGDDKTCLAWRWGDVVEKLERHAKLDTTQTTSLVQAALHNQVQPVAVVDVIGIGAGVVDQLRSLRLPVRAFNASQATRQRDITGSWRFPNVRSAAYWNLRELLDPAHGSTLALPPDDELTAELTAPKWDIRAGGVIVVESKDELRKRLGRSTDSSDAIAMCMWQEKTWQTDEQGRVERPKVRRYADAVSWS
jgi:hypothetical protein